MTAGATGTATKVPQTAVLPVTVSWTWSPDTGALPAPRTVAVIVELMVPLVVTVDGTADTAVWKVVAATAAVWVTIVEVDVPWADSVAVTVQNPAVAEEV